MGCQSEGEPQAVRSFTIYDLRFGNLARLRRGNFAKRERTHIRKAVIGRSYKGTEAPVIYDLQHARRPQADARQLLMYDVGCTTYDLDYSARCAGKRPAAVSQFGQKH